MTRAAAIITTDTTSTETTDEATATTGAGAALSGDEGGAEAGKTTAEGESTAGEGTSDETSAGAPEVYADFVAPEGVTLDPAILDEFKPIAKELNLPQEQAQKVVDLGAKMVQRTIDGIFSQHQEKVGNWLKEAEGDAEIGADIKLGKDSAALRAFNTITKGDEKVKQMVDESGIGNHPEFLRIFYRISKQMREDTFEIPGTGGLSTSPGDLLYPTMKK